MDWFETSTYFYRHWLPEILNRLKPYSIKPKSFDILLGRPKQHRDFVFERAMKTPGDHVLTYFNDSQLNLNQWQWEQHGVRIDSPMEWTVQPVQYYGHPISVSQILPFNIYNQTAYTVVAETCWQNHFSFLQKKQPSPLLLVDCLWRLLAKDIYAICNEWDFKPLIPSSTKDTTMSPTI
jgi:hypothetical protein